MDHEPAQRIPGKRGRLPARRLAMGLLHEYTPESQPLPPATYPVDVTGGINDWQMLGNGPDPTCTIAPEGVGDCTYAGRQHYRMAKGAHARLTETWETSNELVTEYLQYNRGQDQGAVIADLLLSWHRSGKILAFAPVDHTNPAAVDAAVQAFSGVYCGVSLTDDADDLFAEGRPWTVADGQRPDPNSGHCIVKVAADGHALDTWITWGAAQHSTTDWTAACLDEAWVIITQEDAHLVDLPVLQAAIESFHGTGA